jgi:hypothetical protein
MKRKEESQERSGRTKLKGEAKKILGDSPGINGKTLMTLKKK